jgi:lysozyme
MDNKKYIIIAAIVLLLLISKKVSAEKLIAQFEGLRLKAYLDSANIPTIGYGSTKNPFTGVKVKMGDSISKETALSWLQEEIRFRTSAIKKLLKRNPTGNQLTAMTSLAYNIGLGAFQRSCILKNFNSGNIKAAADCFLLYNRAGGKVLPGLVKRRQLEKDLFLS